MKDTNHQYQEWKENISIDPVDIKKDKRLSQTTLCSLTHNLDKMDQFP